MNENFFKDLLLISSHSQQEDKMIQIFTIISSESTLDESNIILFQSLLSIIINSFLTMIDYERYELAGWRILTAGYKSVSLSNHLETMLRSYPQLIISDNNINNS